MSQKVGKNNNKVYKLVLTGGPCGGKTTGQARLCTFFENLGWRVYRVPETASTLMGGGVKWNDLEHDQPYRFQENLIKTMMHIENTFFDLAGSGSTNCLVICDRGTMDPTAYMKSEEWEAMRRENGWNEVELRDNRYNQVIHMVSAAKGAEAFYQTEHITRYESVEFARKLDDITAQSWVGHPYYDVIDNSTDFERKVVRMIAAVCNRLGIDAGDRLAMDSRKRKFLVCRLPEECKYPKFQDFIVAHDYLATPNSKMQARIRRRGQNVKLDKDTGRWDIETGNWTYTHTIRRAKVNEQAPELKMQVNIREYELLLAQKDLSHYPIYKKRRCFLWNNQYFQMDIYQEPCPPRCRGLIILETYTAQGNELALPDYLEIDREVTEDPEFSMYNLSRKPASAMHCRVRSCSEGEDCVAKMSKQSRLKVTGSVKDYDNLSLSNGHKSDKQNGVRQNSAS